MIGGNTHIRLPDGEYARIISVDLVTYSYSVWSPTHGPMNMAGELAVKLACVPPKCHRVPRWRGGYTVEEIPVPQ